MQTEATYSSMRLQGTLELLLDEIRRKPKAVDHEDDPRFCPYKDWADQIDALAQQLEFEQKLAQVG